MWTLVLSDLWQRVLIHAGAYMYTTLIKATDTKYLLCMLIKFSFRSYKSVMTDDNMKSNKVLLSALDV